MAEKFIEPVKPAEAKKQIEDLTKHAAKIVIPQISPETRSTKEIMRARNLVIPHLLDFSEKVQSVLARRPGAEAGTQVEQLRTELESLRSRTAPSGASTEEKQRIELIRKIAAASLEELAGKTPDLRKAESQYRTALSLDLLNEQIRLVGKTPGLESARSVFLATFDAIQKGDFSKAHALVDCSKLYLKTRDSAERNRVLELAQTIHDSNKGDISKAQDLMASKLNLRRMDPAEASRVLKRSCALKELSARREMEKLNKANELMLKKTRETLALAAEFYKTGKINEADYAVQLASNYHDGAGLGKKPAKSVVEARAFIEREITELKGLKSGETLDAHAGMKSDQQIQKFWENKYKDAIKHFAPIETGTFDSRVGQLRKKLGAKSTDAILRSAAGMQGEAVKGRAEGTIEQERYKKLMTAAENVLRSLNEEAELRKLAKGASGAARDALIAAAGRAHKAAEAWASVTKVGVGELKVGAATTRELSRNVADASQLHQEAVEAGIEGRQRLGLESTKRNAIARLKAWEDDIFKRANEVGSAKDVMGIEIYTHKIFINLIRSAQKKVVNAKTKAEVDATIYALRPPLKKKGGVEYKEGLIYREDQAYKRAKQVVALERLEEQRQGLLSTCKGSRIQLVGEDSFGWRSYNTGEYGRQRVGMVQDFAAEMKNEEANLRRLGVGELLEKAKEGTLTDADMARWSQIEAGLKRINTLSMSWSRKMRGLNESMQSGRYTDMARGKSGLIREGIEVFGGKQVAFGDYVALFENSKQSELRFLEAAKLAGEAGRAGAEASESKAEERFEAKRIKGKMRIVWKDAATPLHVPKLEGSKAPTMEDVDEKMVAGFRARGSGLHTAFARLANEQVNEYRASLSGGQSLFTYDQLSRMQEFMISGYILYAGREKSKQMLGSLMDLTSIVSFGKPYAVARDLLNKHMIDSGKDAGTVFFDEALSRFDSIAKRKGLIENAREIARIDEEGARITKLPEEKQNKARLLELEERRAKLSLTLQGTDITINSTAYAQFNEFISIFQNQVKREQGVDRALELGKAAVLLATSFINGGVGLALWAADFAYTSARMGDIDAKGAGMLLLAVATHGASSYAASAMSRLTAETGAFTAFRGTTLVGRFNNYVGLMAGFEAAYDSAVSVPKGTFVATEDYLAWGIQALTAGIQAGMGPAAAMRSRMAMRTAMRKAGALEIAYSEAAGKGPTEVWDVAQKNGWKSEERDAFFTQYNKRVVKDYAQIDRPTPELMRKAYELAQKDGYSDKRGFDGFREDIITMREVVKREVITFRPEAFAENAAENARAAKEAGAPKAVAPSAADIGRAAEQKVIEAQELLGKRRGPIEISEHQKWVERVERNAEERLEPKALELRTPDELMDFAKKRRDHAQEWRKEAASTKENAELSKTSLKKETYDGMLERASRLESDAQLYGKIADRFESAAELKRFESATDAQRQALFDQFNKANSLFAFRNVEEFSASMNEYLSAQVKGATYQNFTNYLGEQRRILAEAGGVRKFETLAPKPEVGIPEAVREARSRTDVREVTQPWAKPKEASPEVIQEARRKIKDGETFVSGEDVVKSKSGPEVSQNRDRWNNELTFDAVRAALQQEARALGVDLDVLTIALDKSGLNNIDRMASEVADVLSKKVFLEIIKEARKVMIEKGYGQIADALLGNGKCDERGMIVAAEGLGKNPEQVKADLKAAFDQAKAEVKRKIIEADKEAERVGRDNISDLEKIPYVIKIGDKYTTVKRWMEANIEHGLDVAVAFTADFSAISQLSRVKLSDMYKQAEQSASPHAEVVGKALGLHEEGVLKPRPDFSDRPQELPPVPSNEALPAGTAFEVNLRLRPEAIPQVERALAEYILGLGEKGISSRYPPVNEHEAAELIRWAKTGRIPIEQFARLVPRKGGLFASSIGMAEGNTFVGHPAMNALEQIVVDAGAARIGGAAGGRNLGNNSFFSSETKAEAKRAALQADISASLAGTGFMVEVKAYEVRAGETPADVQARMLADRFGVRDLDANTREVGENFVRMLNAGSLDVQSKALQGAPPEVLKLRDEIRAPERRVELERITRGRRDLRRLRDVLGHIPDQPSRQHVIDFIRKNSKQIEGAITVPEVPKAAVRPEAPGVARAAAPGVAEAFAGGARAAVPGATMGAEPLGANYYSALGIGGLKAAVEASKARAAAVERLANDLKNHDPGAAPTSEVKRMLEIKQANPDWSRKDIAKALVKEQIREARRTKEAEVKRLAGELDQYDKQYKKDPSIQPTPEVKRMDDIRGKSRMYSLDVAEKYFEIRVQEARPAEVRAEAARPGAVAGEMKARPAPSIEQERPVGAQEGPVYRSELEARIPRLQKEIDGLRPELDAARGTFNQAEKGFQQAERNLAEAEKSGRGIPEAEKNKSLAESRKEQAGLRLNEVNTEYQKTERDLGAAQDALKRIQEATPPGVISAGTVGAAARGAVEGIVGMAREGGARGSAFGFDIVIIGGAKAIREAVKEVRAARVLRQEMDATFKQSNWDVGQTRYLLKEQKGVDQGVKPGQPSITVRGSKYYVLEQPREGAVAFVRDRRYKLRATEEAPKQEAPTPLVAQKPKTAIEKANEAVSDAYNKLQAAPEAEKNAAEKKYDRALRDRAKMTPEETLFEVERKALGRERFIKKLEADVEKAREERDKAKSNKDKALTALDEADTSQARRKASDHLEDTYAKLKEAEADYQSLDNLLKAAKAEPKPPEWVPRAEPAAEFSPHFEKGLPKELPGTPQAKAVEALAQEVSKVVQEGNGSLITYHNERHLGELYEFVRKALGNDPLLRFAVTLHDIGYFQNERDVRTSPEKKLAANHENRSKSYVWENRRALGLSDLQAQVVMEYIELTKIGDMRNGKFTLLVGDAFKADINLLNRTYAELSLVQAGRLPLEKLSPEVRQYIESKFSSADLSSPEHRQTLIDMVVNAKGMAVADVYGQARTYIDLVPGLRNEFKKDGNPATAPTFLEQVANSPGFLEGFVGKGRVNLALQDAAVKVTLPDGSVAEVNVPGVKIPQELSQAREANLQKMREVKTWVETLKQGFDQKAYDGLQKFIGERDVSIVGKDTIEHMNRELDSFAEQGRRMDSMRETLGIEKGKSIFNEYKQAIESGNKDRAGEIAAEYKKQFDTDMNQDPRYPKGMEFVPEPRKGLQQLEAGLLKAEGVVRGIESQLAEMGLEPGSVRRRAEEYSLRRKLKESKGEEPKHLSRGEKLLLDLEKANKDMTKARDEAVAARKEAAFPKEYAAKLDRVQRSIETISEEGERSRAAASYKALQQRAANEANLPVEQRHIQNFLKTASARELVFLLMDRRVDVSTIPSEHFSLVASEVPVNKPKEFDALLDRMRKIPNENERNLFTGLIALRAFKGVKAALGEQAGTLPMVKKFSEMGYPAELHSAAQYLRRFGVDPLVHNEFPWVAHDLMVRSQLFHRIEVFDVQLTASLNKVFPGQEAKIKVLVQEMFERVTVQDVNDTNLRYTPHGWKHSLDVLDLGRNILDASPLMQQSVLRYGSAERGALTMDLTDLLHDIGYGKLKPDDPKGLHPQVGAEIFKTRIAPMLAEILGIDLAKYSLTESEVGALPENKRPAPIEVGGRKMFLNYDALLQSHAMIYDIFEGINLHGADNPKKSNFTPASDTEKPVVFRVRAADNAEASMNRLRFVQQDPMMLEALSRMYNKGEDIKKQNPKQPGETPEQWDNRLRPIIEPEMMKIKQEYLVDRSMTRSIERGEVPADALPRFAKGRSMDDAILFSELLLKLDQGTWPHFVGCERVSSVVIGQEIIDGKPWLVLNMIIKGRLKDTPIAVDLGVNGSAYQVGRADAAFRSLFYGRDIQKGPLLETREGGSVVLAGGIKIRYVEVDESLVKKLAEGTKPGQPRFPAITFGMPAFKLK